MRRSPPWAYAVALLGSVLVVVLYATAEGAVRDFLVTTGFIFAVLAAGALGGWKPGLLATMLSLIGYAFFFIEPQYSFYAHDGSELFGLIGFLVVGAALSGLSETLYRSGLRLEERQRQLEQEIVQHERAEAALKEAERRTWEALERSRAAAAQLRVTLASIGDGVIATDAAGRVTFINGVAESLTGWDQADAQGKALSEIFRIINERTREPVENPCEQVLSTGAVVGLANHTLLVAKDGSELPIDDSAAPILDDGGRILGVVLVFHDASQERAATDALRRLAAIVETSDDAIMAKTIDGRITSWNKGAERLFGYAAEEIIGRSIELLVPEQKREESSTILERVRLGERIEPCDTLRRRKDGTLVNVSLQVSPLTDRYGEIVGASSVARDITERKRTEDALAFLAKMSSSLGALTDRVSALKRATRLMVPFFADWCVIYTLAEQSKIECAAYAHWDPSKEALLKELLDQYPFDWNTDAATVYALRTGRTHYVESLTCEQLRRLARSDDHLRRIEAIGLRSVISAPLQIRGRTVATITFVSSDSGRRYTAADVSLAEELAYRVATAIENAELLESLRAADRQKDDFLAMLAHELRNPLAAINYASSLLETSGQEARAEWIDIVKRQVKNLTCLIDDLLDVSRISRDKIQLRLDHADAAAIVRQAVADVRALVSEKHHELIVEISPEPIPIMADATRVEQIVANLLTNAAKYTPDGGRITVTARAEQDEAVVSVRDTGIGIAREMLPRIFDLFAQADRSLDRSEGGLGIGLTIARKLAEMHDGTVIASSEGVGRGAEFTLRLPLRHVEVRSVERPARSPEMPAVKRRILVVDDNEDTARMESWLLNQLGHEVQVAHHGAAALELADTFHPDAILLDIGLPEIDGYEVARRLRARGFSNGVLVAVSGYGRAEDVERSRAAGFDHHLVKPVDLNTLQSVLQRA